MGDRPCDTADIIMDPSYTLRIHRPEDLPHIVQRHEELYSKEYSYNNHFIEIVTKVTTDFLEHHDPKRERCWIAERNGDFLGCVMLVKDKESDGTGAKLRLLLVEPSARGLGLGGDLVRQCTRFAKEAGYTKIRLWTNGELVSARRIYAKEGYKLVHAEEDDSLGVKSVSEYWELTL
ncbi:GNAT family N-acetyltransferase [Aspergillus pseudodeflectus]|uniref:GNAT family N-acetyltransferase n=1 Tax=Aspergillus pseudodeflectus TaxID=176178 RepID=A0ABR4JQA3_9EURO